MRIGVAIILTLMVCIVPVAAAPATPIWSVSSGVDGPPNNYFGMEPAPLNRLFQAQETQIFTASATVRNGTRFNVGYGFRKDASSGESAIYLAGFDKQLSERWWVNAEYQGDRYLSGVFNLGAAYKIAPNASVSVGYAFANNYELKNLIRTQIYINF